MHGAVHYVKGQRRHSRKLLAKPQRQETESLREMNKIESVWSIKDKWETEQAKSKVQQDMVRGLGVNLETGKHVNKSVEGIDRSRFVILKITVAAEESWREYGKSR